MRVNMMSFLAGLTAAFCLGGGAALAGEDNVWFYTWHSTLPKSVIDAYGASHSTNLIVDTYLVADEAEARLAAGGTGYDLVVVPVEVLPRLKSIDAVRPFEPEMMPEGLTQKTPLSRQLELSVPEAADYAMPFLWGTTGLVYDRDQIAVRLPDAPTDSWELLFDPANAQALSECGISIVDSVQEVVAITLNYLGRDPNSMAQEDLDAAFAALELIMPYVTFVGGEQLDELIDGDACLSLAWSSDALLALDRFERTELEYLVPKQGTLLWADVLVIPSDSHHADHTYELLEYLQAPETLVQISEFSLALTNLPVEHDVMQSLSVDTLTRVAPHDRRDDLFMLTPRTGSEKRALDQRWRRLRLGL